MNAILHSWFLLGSVLHVGSAPLGIILGIMTPIVAERAATAKVLVLALSRRFLVRFFVRPQRDTTHPGTHTAEFYADLTVDENRTDLTVEWNDLTFCSVSTWPQCSRLRVASQGSQAYKPNVGVPPLCTKVRSCQLVLYLASAHRLARSLNVNSPA